MGHLAEGDADRPFDGLGQRPQARSQYETDARRSRREALASSRRAMSSLEAMDIIPFVRGGNGLQRDEHARPSGQVIDDAHTGEPTFAGERGGLI